MESFSLQSISIGIPFLILELIITYLPDPLLLIACLLDIMSMFRIDDFDIHTDWTQGQNLVILVFAFIFTASIGA